MGHTKSNVIASEQFCLTGKTFSINQMYGQKKFKTSDAREWEASIFWQLNTDENLSAFTNLRNVFDPTKHNYSISIFVRYPASEFVTKAGIISAKTQDCSNFEKPLIDLLFLPKYFEQPSPYGVANLNCDDKFITKLQSEKGVGPSHSIEVTISIISRD